MSTMIASFAFDESDVVTAGSVISGGAATITFGSGLQFASLADDTVGFLLGGGNGATIDLGDDIDRSEIELTWDAGFGLSNQAGDDFVIYENGSVGAPEAYAVAVRNAATGQFTQFRYQFFNSFDDAAVNGSADGAGVFATAFDLSDFGLASGEFIDAIRIVNLVALDTVAGSDGQGEVDLTGNSGFIPLDSAGGAAFASDKFDPDITLVAALNAVEALPKPVQLFDASNNFVDDFDTIQAAVDAASAGYTISIAAGTYSESVTINKALTIQGAGAGQTIVAPPSGSGFRIVGNLGKTTPLAIDGISFNDSVNGSGIQYDDNAILGTLQITNSAFEGNFRNGLAIGANNNPVNLDNVILTDSSFIGNGGNPTSQTSSGDGDILFFQYVGDATIQNVTVTGQVVGSGPAENGIQFRSDIGALGSVVLNNVTIDGVYEKQPIAFFNYNNLNGLSATNVVVTADSTSFQVAGNFDGIGGSFSSAGIDTTGAPDPLALQGDNGANTITGGAENNLLVGFGGNDTLNGGAGVDTAGYLGSNTDYAIAVTTDANGRAIGFVSVTDNNLGNGNEGTDTLSSIEVIIFDGNGVTFDLSQPVQVFDTSNNLVGTFDTIQEGVDAALAGYTVLVNDGTYTENVVISESITLRSVNGREVTTIQGVSTGSELGTIEIDPNTNNVTLGGIDQGFTIVGINGNGALEKAAVYIQGNNDSLTIQGNEIVADGDSGLTSEFSAAITNTLIDNNIFSGQTFTGSNPSGTGFSTQFNVGNNVPRQLVVMGNGGSGPYVSSNIVFSNNSVTGIAGGISSDDGVSEQGNNLVTIDADTVLFENNSFTGFTNRFASGLRARGPNSSLVNNTFDNSTDGDTRGVFIDNKGVPGTYSDNTFTGGTDGDVFTGTPGDDDFTLGDGEDVVIGGGGNDAIAGGNGIDTAVYNGISTDYTITSTATSFTSVTDNNASDGDEGADTLSSVEILVFRDITIDLSAPVKLFDTTNTLVATFNSIQAAVDAASDGFRIEIGDGTFREQVTIDGFTDLTIIGNGDTTIIEMVDSPIFNDGGLGTRDRAAVISVVNSSNVVVQNVKVDGRGRANQLPSGTQPDLIGVLFLDSSGSLDGSTVVGVRDPLNPDGSVSGNQRGNAVLAGNTDGSDRTVSITNNEIFDYQKNGITATGVGLTAIIDSNVVTGNGFINRSNAQAQNGIQVSSGAGGSISDNIISEIGHPRDDFSSSYILVFGAEAGLQVTGNIINGTADPSTTFGIAAVATDDLSILNNTVNNVLYGLYLAGNVDNPIVSNNTFTDIVDSFTPLVGGSNPPVPATENFTGLNTFVDGADNDLPLSFGGTDGKDFITGSDFNDFLFGDSGDDTLDGGAGNNNLYDDSGNNEFLAGDGDDIIGIGSGDDIVDAGDGANFIYLANAVGTNGGTNDITTGSGNDNLYLRGGNNTINTGEGNNLIGLGGGNDTVTAGSGDDFVYSIDGGGGTDSYDLGEGDNTVWVEGGDMSVTAGDGTNSVGLANGTNTVTLGDGNNTVYNVNAAAGFSVIDLGDGENIIWMTAGENSIGVGNGNNLIGLGVGNDTVVTGDGNNLIFLIDPDSITDADLNGNDLILSGSGDDEIYLGNGDNIINAGDGNNVVSVSGGTNAITTGTGNDQVFGGVGDDLINPGTGNNTVYGGAGMDTFGLFDGVGITTILDFDVATDKLGNFALGDVILTQGTGVDADNTFVQNALTNDFMAKLLFVDAGDITAANFA